jgi:hypothetical protein
MFMGDRWSYPKQASAATYVWQPVTVAGDSLSINNYKDVWKIDLKTGVASSFKLAGKIIDNADTTTIVYKGNWRHESDSISISQTDSKNDSLTFKFKGTQVAFYALARPDGGYTKIVVKDKRGKIVNAAIVDMYCKYPLRTLKFLSKPLPRDNYSVIISVMGERGNWSDKRKNIYGSTGYFVTLDQIIIKE